MTRFFDTVGFLLIGLLLLGLTVQIVRGVGLHPLAPVLTSIGGFSVLILAFLVATRRI